MSKIVINELSGHVICENVYIRESLRIGDSLKLVSAPEGIISGSNIYSPNINTILSKSVVYRPGYIGPLLPSVYSTWLDAYNASTLYAASGPRTIILDSSLGPLVIPAGSWNMDNITLYSSVCDVQTGSPPILTIEDGATLNGLCSIYGVITCDYQGTLNACINISGITNPTQTSLILDYGAQIKCSGTQPFIRFSDPPPTQLVLGYGADVINSPVPVLDVLAGANVIIVGLGNISSLNDGTISSALTSQILIVIGTPSFSVTLDTSISQPLVLGGISIINLITNSPFIYKKLNPPTVNDDSTLGIKEGDTWIDTIAKNVYICADATPASAIWKIV